MTRIRHGRTLRILAATGAAATALGLLAGPAAAAVSLPSVLPAAGPAAGQAALVAAYASARHLPPRAVGGIRPGSLHLATVPATGVSWAIADFTPAKADPALVAAGFQDGASTGVFTRAAGQSWRLVPGGGPYGCGLGLPAAVRTAWHLSAPAGCGATPATARRAAAGTLAGAPAAGSLRQSIADIALSQVGVAVTPAVTSFSGVDCDPYSTLVAAQSPNQDGCGLDQKFRLQNENEAWCSDFAKWVWQQAGVTADMNTINAGADSFYGWGQDQGETLTPDSGTPAPGDAVVFYPPGPVSATGYADHVGIVTAVHPDGTVDMVNGDFLGASDISVQYNTGISLTSWASQVWNPGEQWVIVTPPAAAQQPPPAAAVTGPRVAVAGTAASFRARASQQGGSVTQYLWTFGDGRTTNAAGRDVSHVFAAAGPHTVTMTATSSLGTVTTRTWNIAVPGQSSALTSAPSTAVWYSSTPLEQLLFLPAAGGGLAAESGDGAGWLRQAVPGQAGPGSAVTAISYPGPDSAMEPHAYFRGADGTLAQSYRGSDGWVTGPLAGRPAAGSAIVATTTAAGPDSAAAAGPGGSSTAASSTAADTAVFYITAAGQLAESHPQGDGWAAAAMPGPRAANPGSLALAESPAGGQPAEHLFYLGTDRTIREASAIGLPGSGWRTATIRPQLGVAAGSPLSAVAAGPAGARQDLFFTDGRGRLAEAASRPGGGWAVSELPGKPAAATATAPVTSLAATSYQLPSGALGEEAFYLTASGQPAVTAWDGQRWQAAALPGPATAILAAAGYPAAGHPEQLFTADGPALRLTASSTAGKDWTVSALPGTVATFADTVLLYAATPADDASALSAASAAGLPAGQVTGSFATAWAAALTGNYLVIAVGQAANNALYLNPCGWDNPSGEIPGSTPFYIAAAPLDRLPGADAYENGAAASAAQTPQRTADLAYYATHGALPPGETSLPAAAAAAAVCSGQPSG